MPPILFVTNSSWTLYHFRMNLMRAAQDAGFEAVACAPRDEFSKAFDGLGIRFLDVPMSLAGTNPVGELLVVLSLWRLYRRESPALVHHFSMKPIIYGSLAARLGGVRAVVNTVTGLGYAFSRKGPVNILVKSLLKVALQPPARVTFQNPDDRRLFIDGGIVSQDRTALIMGSGIDTQKFSLDNRVARAGLDGRPVRFLMYGRMMWEKGVREYCEAAREVQNRLAGNGSCKHQPEFVLLGGAGKGNPTRVAQEWIGNPLTIPGEWLHDQAAKAFVRWMPHDDNVLPYVHSADVVVLPSYYPEGLPRSMLESMSCGKAIITTDTPGCRDAVVHRRNGLLVRARDVASLVEAMSYLIDHPEEIRRMGQVSRQRVLEKFSDEIIVRETFKEYVKAGLSQQKGQAIWLSDSST